MFSLELLVEICIHKLIGFSFFNIHIEISFFSVVHLLLKDLFWVDLYHNLKNYNNNIIVKITLYITKLYHSEIIKTQV